MHVLKGMRRNVMGGGSGGGTEAKTCLWGMSPEILPQGGDEEQPSTDRLNPIK
jgi:hypothetical protein